MLKKAIYKLVEGKDLTEQEAMEAMECIMEGQATPAQIGSFITALRIKGETIDEITGCARVMRQKACNIRPNVDYCIDTCGTGGDGANTFNISTAAAIIAAAGGVKVAKHGNRSVSSRSGSADVLEALGVNINLEPEEVAECIEKVGIGFMFAPAFHKSMKHAAGPRKEIGLRTVFNILGPLTNPAGAKGQVLGVFDENLVELLARVLMKLDVERAMIVHGMDGLDEITISAETKVCEINRHEIKSYNISPEDYGIERVDVMALVGGDAVRNAELVMEVLNGGKGPHRDVVTLNAAAALYVGKKAGDFGTGVELARSILDSGAAARKLEELIQFTSSKRRDDACVV